MPAVGQAEIVMGNAIKKACSEVLGSGYLTGYLGGDGPNNTGLSRKHILKEQTPLLSACKWITLILSFATARTNTHLSRKLCGR